MGLNPFRGTETTKLPPYLQLTKDGKLTPLNVAEFEGQKFDAIYNFGQSRNSLINTVTVDRRIKQNTDNLQYVCFSDPKVIEMMKKFA